MEIVVFLGESKLNTPLPKCRGWGREGDPLRDTDPGVVLGSCGWISPRHWGSERKGARELLFLQRQAKATREATQEDCLQGAM